MAKIANVALTNTFDTWRIRSNQAFDRLSQFAINNSSLYANTITANVTLTISGGLKANNSLGSSGYFLRSNGTTPYWDALPPSTQYLQVSNAVATYATKSNPSTSGLHAHTGRATISTNLAVSGNSSVTGLLTASGRLTVGTNFTVTGNTVLGEIGRAHV